MRFSTRTLYGLKAVLVLAGRYGEGSLSVSQIAKRQSISVAYLEQILNALKKKGLVKSVRGPQGGYMLARKPSELTLHALLELLAGAKVPKSAGMDETALAHDLFWGKWSRALKDGLSETTLKQLVDEAHALRKSKTKSPYTFHI